MILMFLAKSDLAGKVPEQEPGPVQRPLSGGEFAVESKRDGAAKFRGTRPLYSLN